MTDIIAFDMDDLETSGADPESLQELERIRTKVESILGTCPTNRLEVRRLFTRELGVDATPGELRAIGNVASHFSESGAARDLAGTALATWVLAKRDLCAVYEGEELDSEDLGRAARRIPDLLKFAGVLEDEIRSRVQTLSPEDREFLLHVGMTLVPPREPLIAATVLVPRLGQLARASRDDELRSVFPSITDEDAELFGTLAREGQEDGTNRVCIDAVALRTIIHDDLAAWTTMQEEAADTEARDEFRKRLERDKLAYHVVSGRLQKLQDAALATELRKPSEHPRRVQRSLFSTYLGLAPVLKAAAAAPTGSEPTDDAGDPAVDLEKLIEESAEKDLEVDARQSNKASTDEVFLNALTEMRDGKTFTPTTRPAQAAKGDPGREKLRVRVLVSIAAVLVVACVFAYGNMLRTKPTSLRLSVSDLPENLALTNAMTVGPMMYAQVSHHSWDHLTRQERVARVNELGLNAMEEGIGTVYLTDEENVQVAIWNQSTGTKLAGGDPPPPVFPGVPDPVRREPTPRRTPESP